MYFFFQWEVNRFRFLLKSIRLQLKENQNFNQFRTQDQNFNQFSKPKTNSKPSITNKVIKPLQPEIFNNSSMNYWSTRLSFTASVGGAGEVRGKLLWGNMSNSQSATRKKIIQDVPLREGNSFAQLNFDPGPVLPNYKQLRPNPVNFTQLNML